MENIQMSYHSTSTESEVRLSEHIKMSSTFLFIHKISCELCSFRPPPGNNGDARPTQAPSSQRSRCCAGLAASWSQSGECAACSGSTWRRPSSRSWQLSSWSAGSWASSGEWTWSSWQVSTPFDLICFEVFTSCVCVLVFVCACCCEVSVGRPKGSQKVKPKHTK